LACGILKVAESCADSCCVFGPRAISMVAF